MCLFLLLQGGEQQCLRLMLWLSTATATVAMALLENDLDRLQEVQMRGVHLLALLQGSHKYFQLAR